MNKSESIKELASAFAKAQAAIEKAAADKNNPHFRSKYADLGSVVDAIKPALEDNGLSFVQISHDAEGAAKIETIVMHASGEWLSCGVVSVPVNKNDAQGFGSAMTYARRYSLQAAFGVAPEDDDGNAAAAAAAKEKRDAKVAPANKMTDKEKADWNAAIEEAAQDSIETLRDVVSKAAKAAKEANDITAYNHFRNKGVILSQKFEGANA